MDGLKLLITSFTTV